MSSYGAISLGRPALRRPSGGFPLPSLAVPLTTLLIRGGGILASFSLLAGLALYRSGVLTLVWIKVLPIPICGGMAAVCLGIVILCVRALRGSRTNRIGRIPQGY